MQKHLRAVEPDVIEPIMAASDGARSPMKLQDAAAEEFGIGQQYVIRGGVTQIQEKKKTWKILTAF
jgi:hypothetical protein